MTIHTCRSISSNPTRPFQVDMLPITVDRLKPTQVEAQTPFPGPRQPQKKSAQSTSVQNRTQDRHSFLPKVPQQSSPIKEGT